MMTNEKHFDLSQRCKLADYLKKFDQSSKQHVVANKLNSDNATDKKRKIQVENDGEFSKKNKIKKNKFSLSSSNQNKEDKVTTCRTSKKVDDESNRSDKLRRMCMEKLASSQFRNINQYLYENPTVQAIRYMTPDLFKKYHETYSQIVDKWPVKPLDVIINEIEQLSSFNKKPLTIADMGCGEARLARHFKENESNTTVHSFDLFDLNEHITKASMDNVPIEDNQCDIVVFCLSLMSTNLRDCLIEANRIMKKDGLLYIAEVTSRFEDNKFKVFLSSMEQYGFKVKKQITLKPDDYFVLFKFKKVSKIEKLKGLPGIVLKSCKYKAR